MARTPAVACALLLLLACAAVSYAAAAALHASEVTLIGTDQTYSTNDVVYLAVTFVDPSAQPTDPLPDLSELSCTASPAPQLQLNAAPNGAPATLLKRADFPGGSGLLSSNQVVFAYTVRAGDKTATQLDIGAKNVPKASALGDMSTCSVAGNSAATFDATTTSSAGALTLQNSVVIDTTVVAVLYVSTRTPNGKKVVGDTIDILVGFSAPVTVTAASDGSVPSLLLNSGAFVAFGGFPFAATANDNTTIVFHYTVDTGETTTRLDVATASAVTEAFPPDDSANATADGSVTSPLRLVNGAAITGQRNGLPVDLRVPSGLTARGSLAASSNIQIDTGGQKFPPVGYDPDTVPPEPRATRNKTSSSSSASSGGTDSNNNGFTRKGYSTSVSVTVQINNVYSVDAAGQTFKADVLVVQRWYDDRFNVTSLLAQSTQPTTALTKMWSPHLTFVNSKDRPTPFDSKVVVRNSGYVELWERSIGTFGVVIDVTDFPFDTQTLSVQLRSSLYTNADVKFSPLTAADDLDANAQDDVSQQNTILANLRDPAFSHSDYRQSTYSIQSALFAGYDVLETSWTAQRVSTYSVMVYLFPLSVVSIILCLTFWLPLAMVQRVSIPIFTLASILSFNLVLANIFPPVDYPTRMSTYLVWTYVFCMCTCLVQVWIINIAKAIAAVKKDKKARTDAATKKADTAWKAKADEKFEGVNEAVEDAKAAATAATAAVAEAHAAIKLMRTVSPNGNRTMRHRDHVGEGAAGSPRGGAAASLLEEKDGGAASAAAAAGAKAVPTVAAAPKKEPKAAKAAKGENADKPKGAGGGGGGTVVPRVESLFWGAVKIGDDNLEAWMTRNDVLNQICAVVFVVAFVIAAPVILHA